MNAEPDIAAVASLMADPSRARILMALGDGRALPATMLAAEAGIAASTASEHLHKLTGAGLIDVESHGRHRYFRITSRDVAELLESISKIAPATPVRSMKQGTKAAALRHARTCYDHLAGRLGVTLMAALLEQDILTGGPGTFAPATASADRLSAPGSDYNYHVTPEGERRLGDFGIDTESLAGELKRPLIRYCIDWSEQQHHLGGALGAAIASRFFDRGWIRRSQKGRALVVTDEGVKGLECSFGVHFDRRPT